MKITILDQNNIGHDLDYRQFKELGELVCLPIIPNDQLQSWFKTNGSTVVVANRCLFTKEVLEAGAETGLKLLCLTATGTNTVDLEVAKSLGIGVCNVLAYSTQAVAQHTMALALGLINKVHTFHDGVRSLDWTRGGTYTNLQLPLWELHGKQWGILGYGSIGKRVEELARAFGCTTCHTRISKSTRPFEPGYMPLDELLSTSDIVSIHAPMSPETMDLLNYTRLKTMKPSSLLINVGRGGIINEADLARILSEGAIGGAGLDVLWPEPPDPLNPLLTQDFHGKLLITPHVAWAAKEARQRAVNAAYTSISSFLAGGSSNRVV